MKEHTNAKHTSRLFQLDNFRIYLTILVILHHTAMAYSGSDGWLLVDPAVDEISPIFLTFFTAINQSYFMSAFFLLAGYFTPRSFEKKNAGNFLKDRLIRLGIPLIFCSLIIVNINKFLADEFLRGQSFSPVLEYTVGHLWFLQALLLFAFIYVVYRVLADRNPSRKYFQIYLDRFPPNSVLVICIVILAVLTFLVRIISPIGDWVFGFQLAHFVHYIFSFFVGILAYRGDWFNRLTKKQGKGWGIISFVMIFLFFPVIILGGVLENPANINNFMGGMTWQSFANAIWETSLFIGIIIFLLYFFRERFSKANPLLRSMAGNVYTVYIIHQTVLFGMNILFLQIGIPTIIKFFVVSAITVPLCFLLSALIRKLPLVRRVLG